MQQFCVFGNPIAHSKSPLLHNATFTSLGYEARYGRYLLRESSALAQTFCALKIQGANITVPFKEAAFRQSHEVRGIAQEIGAVNTWVLERDKIIGYNTDAQGFYMCVREWDIRDALILGAGGSAKAVAFILRQHGITTHILNRSSGRLEDFARDGFVCFTPEGLRATHTYDIVINTTPAGLNDDTLPLESTQLCELLSHARFCFDLIYGRRTPFLQLAQDLGLQTSDGAQMLINQAALSSELFSFGAISFERALMCMNALARTPL